MTTPPERHKKREDFSVAEIVAAQSAKRRGEEFSVETGEYKAHRNEVLEAGGLVPDREPAEKPLEELTPAEHAERMRIPGRRFGADN